MNGLAATSWGKGRVDLFWIGTDGAVDAPLGPGWLVRGPVAGRHASAPPAVVSWGVGQMEVFAVFPDGQLWDRYWDGSDWHAWESLGGELALEATPACSSWGPERLDVFAQGTMAVWHRWWDGTRWVDWERCTAWRMSRPDRFRGVAGGSGTDAERAGRRVVGLGGPNRSVGAPPFMAPLSAPAAGEQDMTVGQQRGDVEHALAWSSAPVGLKAPPWGS